MNLYSVMDYYNSINKRNKLLKYYLQSDCDAVSRKVKSAFTLSRYTLIHFMMCLIERDYFFIVISKLNNFTQHDLLQNLENIMINKYGYFSCFNAKLFIIICELNIKDFLTIFGRHFKEYGFFVRELYPCDDLFLFFQSNYFKDLKKDSVRNYDKYQIKVGTYLLSCKLLRFNRNTLYLYHFNDEVYLFTVNGEPVDSQSLCKHLLRIGFYLTLIST